MKKPVFFLLALAAATAVNSQANTAKFGGSPTETSDVLREKAVDNSATYTGETSADLAYNFIDSAVSAGALSDGMGWNEAQQSFVAMGTSVFATSDPGTSDFVRLRTIKSIEANLNAKREIIQFIRTELSVENVVTLPDTGLSTEFDNNLSELKRQLNRKMAAYRSALAEAEAAEADVVGGISAEELAARGVIAVLNERGGNLDYDSMAQETAAKIKAAREALLAMESEIDALKSQAETLRGSLKQENTSSIETLASMPLVGAMQVAQFESWDGDQYEVTNIISWSPKQERMVQSLMAGEPMVGDKKGRTSLGQFIRANDWATATGGRKFLDNDGNFYLLGIGTWPITGSGSAARRSAEGMSRSMAQANVALALKGDVTAQSVAQTKAQELAAGVDGTETQVAENYAETISESVQGLNIQGMQRKFGRKVSDPISGQDMFVTVMALGVSEVNVAKEMERTNYSGAEDVVNANQRSAGVKAGLEESLAEEVADTREYEEGRRDAKSPAKSSGVQSNGGSSSAKPEAKAVTGAGSSADAFGF